MDSTAAQLPLFRTHKTCPRCQVHRPIEDFPLRRSAGTQRRSYCVDCKRAQKREYNERNREQRQRAQREYYEQNRDACLQRIRASVAKKPDKYRQIHSDWKAQNKDAVNASTHKRRTRLKHNGGSWTDADWQRLKARYEWRCLMCSRQEITDGIVLCFDHVVPLSLGGFNIVSNGQPLCRSCNSLKHRKVLDLRKD